MKYLSVVLGKIESVYATDPVPTNVANVILMQNVDLQPLEMETDDYMPLMPNFGQGEKIVGATWCSMSGDVLLGGGGAPLGTPPNHGVLLRACAFAEVIVAATSVAYTPVSTGEESLTLYFYWDGVLQKMVGARGSVTFGLNAKKAPVASFKFLGLNKPMTDVAMPVPTLPSVPRPAAVNKANTTFSIGGYAARLSAFSVDYANDVQYRNRTNREDVIVADRTIGGKATVELPLVAEQDFLGAAGYCTLGTAAAVSAVHGTAAGNIITLAMPKVQLLKPKFQREGGSIMLSCDLHAARNAAGNDEISLTYT